MRRADMRQSSARIGSVRSQGPGLGTCGESQPSGILSIRLILEVCRNLCVRQFPEANSNLEQDQERPFLTADQILPQVYEQLRALASQRLARERHALTLQPTALVHEAYLRLAANGNTPWNSKNHFYGAAALAMRRILVENARKKAASKRGSQPRQVPLENFHEIIDSPDDMLDLDEALTRFAAEEPAKADLVQLRFFAGLTIAEAAETLGISLATAERWWSYSKLWLYTELQKEAEDSGRP